MTSSTFSVGTVSATQHSAIVTGTATAWAINGVSGGMFSCGGMAVPIASVESDTSLTLAYAWPGSNVTGATYAIAMETAQASETIWASRHWARIVGQALLAGIVPVASGTLAERDALDPQPANGEWFAHAEPPHDLTFYRKTPGGWEGPYQVRGAMGDRGPIGSGFVLAGEWDTGTTYSTGNLVWFGERSFASLHDDNTGNEPPSADEDDAHWQFVPAAVGPQGDPGPEGDPGVDGAPGESIAPQGDYSAVETYAVRDVVTDQGSSWIALQPTTGNAPPTLPTTSNAYWMLMALKGASGASAAIDVSYDGAASGLEATNVQAAIDEWIEDSGVLGGFRNKVINGNFDIWQRGTTFTTTGFGGDRWAIGISGPTATISRQAFALGQNDVPGNPKYYHRAVVASVAGAANYALVSHAIEGVSTLAGRRATLTFYAKASATAKIGVEIQHRFGTGGSPSTSVFAVAAEAVDVTTSWQRFSLVFDIPSVTGKTLGSNGNDFLGVVFWFDAGSSWNTRASSIGHQSGTFDIAHVSLVEGDASFVADPFSPRHIQQELALCQRYFWRGIPATGINTNAYTAGAFTSFFVPFPVTMRVTPTLSLDISGATFGNATFHQWSVATTYGARITLQGIATGGNAFMLFGSSDFLAADAEL